MSRHPKLRRVVMGIGLIAVVSACNPNPNAPTPPRVGEVAPPTFTLSGTVVESTASGPRPVSFTDVWISSAFRGATNLEGKYSIPGLPAGTYSVRFTSLLHEITTRSVQIGGDTTFDVELVPLESFTLSGTVFEITDAGPVPVAGVHVENSNIHDMSLTDEKGFYSVTVNRGSIYLFVAKSGYRDGTRTVAIDGDTKLDIQLVRQ